jgi:hypothetical protein
MSNPNFVRNNSNNPPPEVGTLGQLLEGVDLWGLPRGRIGIQKRVGPVNVSAKRVVSNGGHRIEGNLGMVLGKGHVSLGRDQGGNFAHASRGPISASISRRKGEKVKGHVNVKFPRNTHLSVGRDDRGRFVSLTKFINW